MKALFIKSICSWKQPVQKKWVLFRGNNIGL